MSKNHHQRRIWTEIAEDIGSVLRKQIVEKRLASIDGIQKRRSANKIIKSLVDDRIVVNNNKDKKKVFFMDHLKAYNHNHNVQTFSRHSKSISSTPKSINNFSSQQRPTSFMDQQKRERNISEQRKRDALIMREYLHKLRIENNVRKIYADKQKKYKVWKVRNMTKSNLPAPNSLFQ